MKLSVVPSDVLIAELRRRGYHVLWRDAASGMSELQKRVYDFVKQRSLANEHAPNLEEIRVHLGAKSRTTPHRIVNQLIERGILKKKPHRMHSITIA